MANIHVERGFFAAGPTPTENLCWLAREVLGAYMDGGTALEADETNDLLQQLDDEGDDTATIWVHETPPLQINKKQSARLSNVPYITNVTGDVIPYIHPGYVALRLEPVDQSPDDQTYVDTRTRQVIFRQANPMCDEDAALFNGFTLEEDTRVPEGQTRYINNLELVLNSMRIGYRLMMQEDSAAFAETYLSLVSARAITGDALLAELLGQID